MRDDTTHQEVIVLLRGSTDSEIRGFSNEDRTAPMGTRTAHSMELCQTWVGGLGRQRAAGQNEFWSLLHLTPGPHYILPEPRWINRSFLQLLPKRCPGLRIRKTRLLS